MPAFRYEMTVRFGDVDHAGIVYYPRFFHYFHVTLEELFGGASYRRLLDERRIGLPAVHVECDFKRPLFFGDRIVVEASLDRLGDKSLTLRYVVSKVGEEALGACAEGRVTSAALDLDRFEAVPLPDDLRELFGRLA